MPKQETSMMTDFDRIMCDFMILLSTIGLRRVAALVGRRAWLCAVEDRV